MPVALVVVVASTVAIVCIFYNIGYTEGYLKGKYGP